MWKSLKISFVFLQMANNVVYGEGGYVRAALGKQWQSIPNTRIYIDKVIERNLEEGCSTRQATLVKSSKQVVSST